MRTAEQARRYNLLGLVKTLRKKGIMTAAELSEYTGIPQQTLHPLINELACTGVIGEAGTVYAANGRPVQRYNFRADSRYIFGVLLSFEFFEIVLYDFAYKRLKMDKIPVDVKFISAEATIDAILRAAYDMMEEFSIPRKAVCGMGFNIPGPVDSIHGIVLDLAHLQQWENVPMRDIIQRKSGIPVFIEKDACASALGMKWYAGVPEKSTLAYLSFIEGLGMSLLINDMIYRGENRMMGEIGHIPLDTTGPLCNCGDRGCIELYASDVPMLNRICERLYASRRGVLWEVCHGSVANISLESVKEAGFRHDPLVVTEMEKTADYIAFSIVAAIKLFDPNIVMLGHSWLKDFPNIFRRVTTKVYESYFFAQPSTVKIETCNVDKISLIGAAAVVFENELDDMENSSILRMIG